MKRVNTANYQKDKLYPAVMRSVSEILKSSKVVAPVDVLQRMEWLTKQHYEDWRFGRIPYLERVCRANLAKLNRMLRILNLHAQARGLKPSHTEYRKWGRGGKRIVLRFSKSGDPLLESAYSRHYIVGEHRPKSRPTTVGGPAVADAASVGDPEIP